MRWATLAFIASAFGMPLFGGIVADVLGQKMIGGGLFLLSLVTSVISIFLINYFAFLQPYLEARRLKKVGQRAEASILSVWDTGSTVNDNPVVGMKIEFQAQGAAVTATFSTPISRIQTHLYQPGQKVTILYDPRDHARIMLSP